MNLLKLLRDADRKLDTGEITIGEYKKIIAPLKDVVPVKRGRWECGDKYENAVCSVCGYDTGEAYGFGYGNGCYNFCPMCGADMRRKRGRKGR